MMRKRRWIISVVVFVFISSALLYLTMHSRIQLVTSIPAVFQEQEIQYKYINGMTYIVAEQQHVNTPVVHDEEALYVLNGAGDDFKKFYIDDDAGELVIRKNIMLPKTRNKTYF